MIGVFYNSSTTNDYKQYPLGDIESVIIVNDGANAINFSQDGKNNSGIVYTNESLEFKNISKKCDNNMTFYIKSLVPNAPSSFRLWGW